MNAPFVRVLDNETLRRSAVVCCGGLAALKSLFFDPRTFEAYETKTGALGRTWRHLEKCWREVFGNGGAGALGLTTEYGGDMYIMLPEWDSRVFVHEAYHAVQGMLRATGTQDDEELGAYLVEWLFEKICWSPPKAGEAKRKRKEKR